MLSDLFEISNNPMFILFFIFVSKSSTSAPPFDNCEICPSSLKSK
jgi:hypothetical protein